MKRFCFILLSVLFLSSCISTGYKKRPAEYKAEYDKTVSQWRSYKDIEKFLKRNFQFDTYRVDMIVSRIQKLGSEGLLVRHHHKFFANPYGYCADSANFSLNALNDINPNYNARTVFVYNKLGMPHHWVTAFEENGKIYVMDYGTSDKWSAMQGTHGPYESLSEYEQFLSTLSIPFFRVEIVFYREFPGTID